jgi:hypothetical protein
LFITVKGKGMKHLRVVGEREPSTETRVHLRDWDLIDPIRMNKFLKWYITPCNACYGVIISLVTELTEEDVDPDKRALFLHLRQIGQMPTNPEKELIHNHIFMKWYDYLIYFTLKRKIESSFYREHKRLVKRLAEMKKGADKAKALVDELHL